MAARIVAVILAAFHILCGVSGEFLSSGPTQAQSRAQHVAFLAEVEQAFGSERREAIESRISEISQSLDATFASLPKNARGAISASSARYAIHRFFVQRHGWQIKGLASEDGSWDQSVLGLARVDHFPKSLMKFVEEQMAHDDFHLQEVAMLSAAMEALIRSEEVRRLRNTYRSLGNSTTATLSEDEAWLLMDTYLVFFTLGGDLSSVNATQVHDLRVDTVKNWDYWIHVHELSREVQQEVAPGLVRFTFPDVLEILEAIHNRLGRHVDGHMCQDVENKLVHIEEASGTGKITMRAFYESHINGDVWQFSENPEYLKQLGVLDESNPSMPRVMIPNYLSMKANCLTVSGFYELCCIDACEDLIGHLERQIRAPHATPEKIISLVSSLASESVAANRTLSKALVAKLEEIAAHHGGQVPLHGRLFAQWMHFAYPRDCAYPHVSGKTNLVNPIAWSKQTGKPWFFSSEEMQSYLDSLPQAAGPALAGGNKDEEDCSASMWVNEEELVDTVNGKPPMQIWPALCAALRVCAVLAVVLSSAVGMSGLARQVLPPLADAAKPKPCLARLAKMGFGGSAHERLNV